CVVLCDAVWQATTAIISGSVSDSTGAVLPNTRITATNFADECRTRRGERARRRVLDSLPADRKLSRRDQRKWVQAVCAVAGHLGSQSRRADQCCPGVGSA